MNRKASDALERALRAKLSRRQMIKLFAAGTAAGSLMATANLGERQVQLFGQRASHLARAAEPANDAFWRTWARTDLPVAELRVSRTWMWGPEPFTEGMLEEYVDSPGEQRLVQYFDKSRMEINDPNADPNTLWYVTNGLLANELITGRIQLGHDTFEQLEPAPVHIAGDPDPNAPTYATFAPLVEYGAIPLGWTLIQTVSSDGHVGANNGLATYGVTAAHHVPQTEHTVASVFWELMNSSGLVYRDGAYVEDRLFENPFYGIGFPITEAYWTRVRVAGQEQDVLVQCFERRVLTYTPNNPPGWRVEAGNIGQHYYDWRYGEEPEYARRYAQDGPPDIAPVVELVDHSSFPPLLTSAPSDEEPNTQPSVLDISDAQIAGIRAIVLGDARVREALGDRFVEIAAGVDIPEKSANGEESAMITVGFEFFSYSHVRSVRVDVHEGDIVLLEELPDGYQPPETQEEIEQAVRLIISNPDFAHIVEGAEPEGILTLSDESRRALYIQFVLQDGRIVFAAIVDLIDDRILGFAMHPDDTDEPSID